MRADIKRKLEQQKQLLALKNQQKQEHGPIEQMSAGLAAGSGSPKSSADQIVAVWRNRLKQATSVKDVRRRLVYLDCGTWAQLQMIASYMRQNKLADPYATGEAGGDVPRLRDGGHSGDTGESGIDIHGAISRLVVGYVGKEMPKTTGGGEWAKAAIETRVRVQTAEVQTRNKLRKNKTSSGTTG